MKSDRSSLHNATTINKALVHLQDTYISTILRLLVLALFTQPAQSAYSSHNRQHRQVCYATTSVPVHMLPPASSSLNWHRVWDWRGCSRRGGSRTPLRPPGAQDAELRLQRCQHVLERRPQRRIVLPAPLHELCVVGWAVGWDRRPLSLVHCNTKRAWSLASHLKTSIVMERDMRHWHVGATSAMVT